MDNSQLVTAYDLSAATGEILIMLLIMFALGGFLGWLVAQNAADERRGRRTTPRTPLSLMPPHETPKSATKQTAAAGTIPLTAAHTTNLQVIVGIGPKVEEALHAQGIHTLDDLSEVTVSRLEAALRDSGNRVPQNVFAWPEQARLILEEARRNSSRSIF